MRRLIIGMLAAAVAAIGAAGREFVHIFTSKDGYETCEDLWFKCLVLDDSTFSLSGKAQTAFVEIVSPGDSTVWREKYPVVGGECRGQVYVGDDWDAGVYRIYVHTGGEPREARQHAESEAAADCQGAAGCAGLCFRRAAGG